MQITPDQLLHAVNLRTIRMRNITQIVTLWSAPVNSFCEIALRSIIKIINFKVEIMVFPIIPLRSKITIILL
jgi:hypothetical protein